MPSLGPTCKKMSDLSAAKTFKAAAFEPSEDDVRRAVREKRKRHYGKRRSSGSSKIKDEDSELDSDADMDIGEKPSKTAVKREFTFTGTMADLGDSSDEELPDLADLWAGRNAKKVKQEAVKVKAEGKKKFKKRKPNRISSDVSKEANVFFCGRHNLHLIC